MIGDYDELAGGLGLVQPRAVPSPPAPVVMYFSELFVEIELWFCVL